MKKNQILVIEDDLETKERLRDILGKAYELEFVKDIHEAEKQINAVKPAMVLLDFDLKEEDGLQVYYKLCNIVSDIKVIMLSYSGSIPLAVKATKAGVADFLQKPLNSDHVQDTIARNLSQKIDNLVIPQKIFWLHGESKPLHDLVQHLGGQAGKNSDIMLFGEKGIEKKDIAEVIHINGKHHKRKLVSLNLSTFPKELLESYFWTLFKKLLSFPDPNYFLGEEALCGTIYLEGVEEMDEMFIKALFDLLNNRGDRLDRSIRVIIPVSTSQLDTKNFTIFHLPNLRKRKEDLAHMINYLLERFSSRSDKKIKYLSSEALNFLNSYDYPGNYIELERIIELAVLSAKLEKIELKDLPFSLEQLKQVLVKEEEAQNMTLDEATRHFEKHFYQLLLDKMGNDFAAAAKFLNIPTTIFEKRFQELAKNLVN